VYLIRDSTGRAISQDRISKDRPDIKHRPGLLQITRYLADLDEEGQIPACWVGSPLVANYSATVGDEVRTFLEEWPTENVSSSRAHGVRR
jgi:hypothetical protein